MGPALVGEVFGSNICEVVRDPALVGEVFGLNIKKSKLKKLKKVLKKKMRK